MLKIGITTTLLVVMVWTNRIGLGAAQPETLTPQVFGAAADQMTLAAVAYVDDSSPVRRIKAAVKRELAKTAYATQGRWQLVWGPATRGGNLVYIARDKRQTRRYSVVIRGTDFDLLDDDIEDVWVSQAPYPYADRTNGLPKVSRGALDGLHNIRRMTDGRTGQDIEAFLKDAAAEARIDLVITGHSLGGGLASLVLLWLHDTIPRWDIPITNIRLSGYTFAGQTVGNAEFANYFNESVGSRFYRFVNPLDIVPRSYGDLSSVIDEDVPGEVPLKYRLALDALRAYLSLHGLRFHQVDTEMLLESVRLPPSTPYLAHVVEQHRPNSYLYLLGAPQLDVGKASALPRYDD